jgi:hypothetical protein
MSLTQLDTDLWIADSPLRFFGLEVGTRMTIIRLPGAGLLLHSPIEATPERVREVEALGNVACLVAPNRFHHLFVDGWQRACPEASLYVAPGLEAKRPDLEIAGVLTDEAEPAWRDVVDQALLHGLPFTNEVVFHHRPSATLLASDLAFNLGASAPTLTRLAFRLAGAHRPLSPTHLERILVRDRVAFRRSLERILEWPFDRVVVAHGEVSERGGREDLVRGYAWLLNAPGGT